MPKKQPKKVTKPTTEGTASKTASVVQVEAVDSTDNEYNVQADQWAKWSKAQRSRFNEVYSAMRMSPSLFTHPDAPTVPVEHWTTIAWNAAWVAAGA